MPQKPNLVKALQQSAGRKRMATLDTPDHPSRAAQANVTGYFALEVKDQLRMLAAQKRCTITQLLAEALNDFFAKNGKPEIARTEP